MLADVSNVSPSSEQRDEAPCYRYEQIREWLRLRWISVTALFRLHLQMIADFFSPFDFNFRSPRHQICRGHPAHWNVTQLLLKIQIKKMNKRRTERRIRPSELSQSQWLCHYLAVAPFLFSWHPNLLSCMRLGRGVFFGYCRSRLFINLGFASASCHHVLLILCCRSGCFSSSGWVCGFPLQRISSVTFPQKA